jgi:hypothetical protein
MQSRPKSPGQQKSAKYPDSHANMTEQHTPREQWMISHVTS